MKHRWKQLVLTLLLVTAGASLFPSSASAISCACYFSKYNDCYEIYVNHTHDAAHCEKTCKDQTKTDFKKVEFNASNFTDTLIQFRCDAARSTAIAAKEKEAQVAATGKTTTDTNKTKLEGLTPKLNVEIPGLKFSPVKFANSLVETGFISEYIEGVYKYLITIAVTLAIVMTMIGGLQYAFGAVTQEQISKAKKRIKNGITGLVLLLSAVLILRLVNPNLIELKPLTLQTITAHDIPAVPDPGSPSGTKVKAPPCRGPNKPSVQHGFYTVDRTLDKYACGTRNLKKVKYIVMHEGSWGGDTIKVLEGRGLSTHYVIRRDGKVIQTAGLEKRARHAGGINHWSVGIDLDMNKECRCGNWPSCKKSAPNCVITNAQYAALRPLLFMIILKTGVKFDNEHIVNHCNIGGHGDVRNFDWSKIGLKNSEHRKSIEAGKCIRRDWEKEVSGT